MVVWRTSIDDKQHTLAADMASGAGLRAEEYPPHADASARLFVTLERLAVMTFEVPPPTGAGQWHNELQGRHAVALVLDPIRTRSPKAHIHLFGWVRWIAALIPGSIVASGFVRSIVHPSAPPTPWSAWAFASLVLLGLFVFPLFLSTIWWVGCIRAIITLRGFMKAVTGGASAPTAPV